MNEKIQAYINEQKELKKEALSQQLVDEGIYDKVFAPVEITGYGHPVDGSCILKFPLKKAAKSGDTTFIIYNGQKTEVIIDKIQCSQNASSLEYPFTEYDNEFEIYRMLKKVPIKLTDDEYTEISKQTHKEISLKPNPIAVALTIIASLIFVGGFIAGIICGNVEIKGIYYDYTEFSFEIACIYWFASLVSGTVLLAFAEIIKLLDCIRQK